jgi:hypothetical protein
MIPSNAAPSPAYTNYYTQRNGGIYGGGYTVITAHEAAEPEQLNRVTALPQISRLISISS